MKHDWSDPDASGLMLCKRCNAHRWSDLKGWHKTHAILNDKRQPYCEGKK